MTTKKGGLSTAQKIPKKRFARWLETKMQQRVLTQTQIAKSLGVTQQTVSAYLSGDRVPTVERLGKLIKFCGETPEKFWKEIEA